MFHVIFRGVNDNINRGTPLHLGPLSLFSNNVGAQANAFGGGVDQGGDRAARGFAF